MKVVYKKVGETPLECLNRFRIENGISADEKLSYIGRLDPMAEGDILIIEGEENKEREKYLHFDKTYEVTFVFGMSTDTGDVLGLIKGENQNILDQPQITEKVKNFENLKSQKYPWFSSKTVLGKSLFNWFKEGKNSEIERPERNIEIFKVDKIVFSKITKVELENEILHKISLVNGDFRQTETIKNWQDFFDKNTQQEFSLVSFEICVSTGTYIRALTEQFDSATLLRLKRTKIHLQNS